METAIVETVGREEFEKLLKFKMSPANIKLVMEAYRLSKYGHRGQERQNGERYFEHPKAVALIFLNECNIYDHEIIIAALLHDNPEDTFIFGAGEEAFETIKKDFGERPSKLVRSVTKLPCTPQEKAQRDCQYYNNLFNDEIGARILKVIDRTHNLRTLKHCNMQKQDKQLLETSICIWRIAESVATERPDIFAIFSKAYQEARETFHAQMSGKI